MGKKRTATEFEDDAPEVHDAPVLRKAVDTKARAQARAKAKAEREAEKHKKEEKLEAEAERNGEDEEDGEDGEGVMDGSSSSTASDSERDRPDYELIAPSGGGFKRGTVDENGVYHPYRKTLKEGEPGTLTGRPLRLYADGIFDLFHFGHAKALQQCKQAYPNVYLLVGCCNDKLTHELKGRTVMTEDERYESVRHCKWVDEVVENAPWVVTDEFLIEHKIDYVCHDALPYTDTSGEADSGDVYARLREIGKFLETSRTEGISTSDLIIRIISEYDSFIRRNLARGYTGKDMNVPFMKEQSIKLDMTLDKFKQNLHKWMDKAEDMEHSFLELFSKEGKLRTSFRKRRKIFKDRVTEMAREGLC